LAICIAPSIIFIGVVDVCSNKYYFDTYPVCGKSAGLYTAYQSKIENVLTRLKNIKYAEKSVLEKYINYNDKVFK